MGSENTSDAPAGADTIRILVATDNHVGYNERDPIRGDDSARTFDEIMRLASKKSVDMVLLAGDLFHENKPSRKSLNSVMRSLRMNCLGDKPCELEMLSDPTEHFDPTFDHVNYEDHNINVAIPVFSIHGNHDDPSGEGHLAALDLLQTCGLLNYYGRTLESDNILIKPLLLQKGRTKLALYGMSNVRDERLFRTFRDGKVKFFRPNTQKDNWFNLMSVHQNHHAYTQTGFLPENFLPDFLDLVVWGHEHECLINPKTNPETSFQVIQPGSSVATSLMPGEAVDKHVTVLEVTGTKFTHHPIKLKTVRPFVMKEIILQEEKGMKTISKKSENRSEVTRYLMGVVEELIEEARQKWHELHNDEESEDEDEKEMPLPLIRLRVEYTAPDGGKFECENPQRFSNRFEKKVANINDVVQFHKKKVGASRKAKGEVELPDESRLAQLTLDTVRVERLVREFLAKQQLTVFEHNQFGHAVGDFVDKDDKHAMETFIDESLHKAFNDIKERTDIEAEQDITGHLEERRSNLEKLFEQGHVSRARSAHIKPKPDHWDSDVDGEWADQPGAFVLPEVEAEEEVLNDSEEIQPTGRGSKTASTRGTAKKRATSNRGGGRQPARANARSSKSTTASKQVLDSNDEDSQEIGDDDVIMLDNEDVVASTNLTANRNSRSTSTRQDTKTRKPASRGARTQQQTTRQTTLDFSQPTGHTRQSPRKTGPPVNTPFEISDDEISDDDDAFEPAPSSNTRSKSRR